MFHLNQAEGEGLVDWRLKRKTQQKHTKKLFYFCQKLTWLVGKFQPWMNESLYFLRPMGTHGISPRSVGEKCFGHGLWRWSVVGGTGVFSGHELQATYGPWWFRNPANSPVDIRYTVCTLFHYLQGFCIIPTVVDMVLYSIIYRVLASSKRWCSRDFWNIDSKEDQPMVFSSSMGTSKPARSIQPQWPKLKVLIPSVGGFSGWWVLNITFTHFLWGKMSLIWGILF